MFEFLTSANYWYETAALMINTHQAGLNMIPQEGWRQAVEAWLYDKIKD